MERDMISHQILPFLPEIIGGILKKVVRWDQLEEIRIRLNQPLQLLTQETEIFLDELSVTKELMHLTFQKVSRYSVYAHKEEIREGFVTLPGGHRAGICGKICYDDEGCRAMREITSLNIRIAHTIPGCSDSFFHKLTAKGNFLDTLIISPPGHGKTTYLRDIIFHISNGTPFFPGKNISVVDERGEIANHTIEGDWFELGKRTDVLDRCPKADGMVMMLRAMGPSVLAADEIGSDKDIQELKVIRNSGCSLLMTAHGRNREDVLNRPVLGEYLLRHPFQRYVVIEKEKGGKRMVQVYNELGEIL